MTRTAHARDVARATGGRFVLFDWGGTLVADTADGSHEEPLRLMPGAREALDALAADGVRCGIVTNTRTARRADVEARLASLGLLERFPVVVTSLDARVRKPDPRIFARALEEAGAAPDRAAMVGNDGLADVAGARAAGLFAVLYDPEGSGPALGPDALVRDLRDVPGVVRRALGGP